MRGECQSRPRWIGVMRPLESVRNVHIEEEAKEAMSRKRSRVGRDANAVDCIKQYIKPWGQKSHNLESV